MKNLAKDTFHIGKRGQLQLKRPSTLIFGSFAAPYATQRCLPYDRFTNGVLVDPKISHFWGFDTVKLKIKSPLCRYLLVLCRVHAAKNFSMDHEARAREISPNIMREITWKIELAKLFFHTKAKEKDQRILSWNLLSITEWHYYRMQSISFKCTSKILS